MKFRATQSEDEEALRSSDLKCRGLQEQLRGIREQRDRLEERHGQQAQLVADLELRSRPLAGSVFINVVCHGGNSYRLRVVSP